jgi:hypothetical protein
MQQQKNKALEDKKIAVLEAKYIAQLKKAEETAKIKLEQDKKKAEEAQENAKLAAEKREKKRYDAELAKKARIETRNIIAETKKEIAEERRKKAEEQKKALKELQAQERAAKRARYSDELRRSEVLAPLQQEEGVVQVPVHEAHVVKKTKKVCMFDELRAPK